MPGLFPAQRWAMIGWLHDPRLTPLALSPSPAWLWSPDAAQVLWANPIGAAVFGAPTPAALAIRTFERTHTAAAEVARIAPTLRAGGGARLERLRGFGAAMGGMLTCACARLTLPDGTSAVLIVALDRSGPELSIAQQVQRLLAACVEPVAVFGDDGILIAATPAARKLIGNKPSLDALGAQRARCSGKRQRSRRRRLGGRRDLDRSHPRSGGVDRRVRRQCRQARRHTGARTQARTRAPARAGSRNNCLRHCRS